MNYSPENKLICRFNIWRTYSKIGLIINSERAFSEPVAPHQGILSERNSARDELVAISGISGRNRSVSTSVKLNSCLTQAKEVYLFILAFLFLETRLHKRSRVSGFNCDLTKFGRDIAKFQL